MLEKILLSIICFALFLFTHWVVFYFGKFKERRFEILKGILYVFTGVYTILAFSIPSNLIQEGIEVTSTLGSLIAYANGLILYGLLFVGYGHAYFLTDRSVSVRTFIELSRTPSGTLTLEELLKIYDHATMLGNRLHAMEYGGFIEKTGNAYSLTFKGKFAARFFSLGRKILHSPPGY